MATRIVHLDDSTGKMARAARPRIATPAGAFSGTAHSDRNVPSLTGVLGPSLGARLLMDLFVDERTGRLVVEAAPGPRGTLFLLAGEPVHAAHPGLIGALEKRLTARGALRSSAAPAPPAGLPRVTTPAVSTPAVSTPAVSTPHAGTPTSSPSLMARTPSRMNLLAALTRRSHPVAVLEALRDEVREFCAQLLSSQFGEWAFFDDSTFIDHTVLTAVNPFGFVLEARRRSLSPDALLRLGDDFAQQAPAPKGGFANVSSRLRAFTGQVDLATVVDGAKRAAEVYAATGLDPMIGGLVLGTLSDVGLVEMLPEPRATSTRDRRKAKASSMPALVQADATQLSQLASLPGRAGGELLSLYLEIKPERDDAVILAVDGAASAASIERGFQQRLAEIDPRAIPAGANRPYLLARAEELRHKIERVYRTMTSTQTRGAPAAYDVGERIGEGGMAEVFRGHASDDPKRVVAIKRILPKLRDDPDFARQFLEEARLARRVQHPNVIRIYTVGKSGDDLYLAMELVDGFDLGELVRRSKKQEKLVPVEIACRIVADACGGLHAAHTALDRSGVITPIFHRDVSTQNILVGKNGDVKLTDFGIAKAVDTHDTVDPDDNNAVKGKIPYLAPELFEGGRASVRSDVYAMAMTMYATLHRLPFARGDMLQTMRAVLHEPLPRLATLRPDVPEAVDAVLARAAARNPDERHASAQELQLDLEEVLTKRTVDVGVWVRMLAARPVTRSAPRGVLSLSRPDDVHPAHLVSMTRTVPIVEINTDEW